MNHPAQDVLNKKENCKLNWLKVTGFAQLYSDKYFENKI